MDDGVVLVNARRTSSRPRLLAFAACVAAVPATVLAVSAVAAAPDRYAPRVVAIGANPNGPATARVTAATKAVLACFEANGARRVPLSDEPGFAVEGLSADVHAACADQESEWKAADRSPAYRREQDALTVVLGEAWRCVAARGFVVPGINDGGVKGAHVPVQPGVGNAFDACVAEVARAFGVTVPR